MTAHKHADLMLQYAQDAAKTEEPWERWEYNNDRGWHQCENIRLGSFAANTAANPRSSKLDGTSFRNRLQRDLKKELCIGLLSQVGKMVFMQSVTGGDKMERMNRLFSKV